MSVFEPAAEQLRADTLLATALGLTDETRSKLRETLEARVQMRLSKARSRSAGRQE